MRKNQAKKPAAHDVRMKKTYLDIYRDFYDLHPSEVKNAKRIILKNLKESGIKSRDLPSLNVLNVGTGREAYVFHLFGVRKVYHFDVSDRSVQALTRLRDLDPKFRNIITRQTDICKHQNLVPDDKIDFVYLNGVLHHLYDPLQAIKNIDRVLSDLGKCFFRIYRSGSLAFFIVDYIRRFIGFKDRAAVNRRFRIKFPGSNAANEIMYSDLQDDFFVPVLRLYAKAEMDAFFEQCGFKTIVRQTIPSYDHANYENSSQGVSLIYEKGPDTSIKGPFPRSIDQLSDISYKEKRIVELVFFMKSSLEQIRRRSSAERADLALDLYKTSQLMRIPEEIKAAQKWAQLDSILRSSINQYSK